MCLHTMLALALALEVVSRLARQHLSICTPAIYETDEGSTTKHRPHCWAHSRLLRLERVPSSVDALEVAALVGPKLTHFQS
jgi:hypothetical protein